MIPENITANFFICQSFFIFFSMWLSCDFTDNFSDIFSISFMVFSLFLEGFRVPISIWKNTTDFFHKYKLFFWLIFVKCVSVFLNPSYKKRLIHEKRGAFLLGFHINNLVS